MGSNVLYKVIANHIYSWDKVKDAEYKEEAEEAINNAEDDYQKALVKYQKAIYDVEEYKESIESYKNRINSLHEYVSVANTEATEMYNNIYADNGMKNQYTAAQSAVNEQKATINTLNDQLTDAKGLVESCKADKESAQSKYNDALDDYNKQSAKVADLYEDMQKATTEYNKAKADYDAAEAAQIAYGTPIPEDIVLAYSTKRAVYRLAVSKYNSADERLSELSTELSDAGEELSNANNALLDANDKLAQKQQELTNAQQHLVTLEIRATSLQETLQAQENAYNEVLVNINTANNEIAATTTSLTELTETYNSLLASLYTLKNNVETSSAKITSTKRKYSRTTDYAAVLYYGTVVNLSGNSGWVRIVDVVENKTVGEPEGSYIEFSSSALMPVPKDNYTESYVIDYDQTRGGTVNPYRVAGDKVEQQKYRAAANTGYSNYYSDSASDYRSLRNVSGKYRSEINNGLKMINIRPILGLPPQLLPLTDIRIDSPDSYDVNAFGRVYSSFILNNIPLLLLQPGKPKFLSSSSKKQKIKALENIFNGLINDLSSLFKNGVGKFYSFEADFTAYYGFVNTVLRSAAVMLNIHNETVYGMKLGEYNWLYSKSGKGRNNFNRFIGPYTGCIALYCDVGSDVSDTFSNSTSQSNLASQINSYSDQARELAFFLGIGAGQVEKLIGTDATNYFESNIEKMSEGIERLLGDGAGGIFNSLIGKVKTVLSGGRLIFPEIWTDSNFGRSYSCKMKLVALYGNPLCVFLQILVPFAHVFCMTMPKESAGGQGYSTPFLVRGWFKGVFNIDMGIITDFTFSRGGESEWTVDGLPTVAEISFSIKDMYDGMSMSSVTGKNNQVNRDIISNVAELDYIANACGVNINANEVKRIAITYMIMFKSKIIDEFTTNIFGGIIQYFNNKINSIFGVF